MVIFWLQSKKNIILTKEINNEKKLIEKTLPALPGYAEMKSAPDNMHTCAVCKFWYPNAEMTYGHCVADLRISRGTNGDGYCNNFKYRGR